MIEHIIFKALSMLDEAIDLCSPTPVKQNVGWRVALPVLFLFSDGDPQMSTSSGVRPSPKTARSPAAPKATPYELCKDVSHYHLARRWLAAERRSYDQAAAGTGVGDMRYRAAI